MISWERNYIGAFLLDTVCLYFTTMNLKPIEKSFGIVTCLKDRINIAIAKFIYLNY